MLKPAHDFQFHGKWLIRYDSGEFTYPEILILLPSLQNQIQQQKLNFKFININFSHTILHSRFFTVGDYLFISHNGGEGRFAETDPGAFAIRDQIEPLSRPIHLLNLLFPRLESDPRWKTMGLPSGQLLLASGLQANGFEATPLPLVLPTGNLSPQAFLSDMTGITLFEDLLPCLRPFLAGFKALYKGWLAAGGPFPTLAPLAALYHLPQVNLFVRGEAEQALPEILNSLNHGEIETLFRQSGFAWQQPGLIIMSDFNRVNRPETFKNFQIDLSFLKPEHLAQGLEMNFSRGCKRGCMFCCRVQGTKIRKLPLGKAEDLLKKYRNKITEFSLSGEAVQTVNINDDDILQDPVYAARIFSLLKENGLRIYGIQSAPASLFQSNDQVNSDVVDLTADTELFVDNRPLLWLGTDVFLKVRARRLGKVLPSPEGFFKLLCELDKRHIRHYHYWISSDSDSTWEEFVEELSLIIDCYRSFPHFSLLAHAPFIVPYPASRLFRLLPDNSPKLKIKLDLAAPDPSFGYQVIERLETSWTQLNNLLKNEKAGGEMGFFDFLKEKDFAAAAQLAYHFLKQEQLQSEKSEAGLGRTKEQLEKVISKLLELSD